MNNYIQNKKTMLKELETMISKKNNGKIGVSVELSLYCEFIKKVYLSGSTNN